MEREGTQSAQYVRSLLEASLDPLVTISAEGKITDVNEASVKVTGVLRQDLIGTDFSNYFTEPHKARQGYEQVFEEGFVADYPLTIKHINGKLTHVLYNASVYKNAMGVVLGVFAAARDVTDQTWAIDLRIANTELAFQNDEKEKRAAELSIANTELAFQNDEKEKRAAELSIANTELAFQNDEKEKRAAELAIANAELAFQNKVKENRAAELVIANEELAFQNEEKEKRALELSTAIEKIESQSLEREKRAAVLSIANYSRSLIEAILDPLFTISPEGKITDVNHASADFTGVAREKLIGTDFFGYFTESDKARHAYEKVFSDGYVVDYPLTIKDHRFTDVLFNGSVYKDEDGKVVGAVVVGRDITEQKRIGNELLEAKVIAEMAAVIAEEAQAQAETATHKANDAVKAKQQFLSNMSHEIRTPMNAIIGFTKVVMKTELSVRQREYLNAIKLSGDALIVLINDILDLAKVDAGKMSFEKTPFKLAASISAMLHLFETKIHEKNLALELEYDSNIPEVLEGDPVRLHQIILNLVSNAVKFTSEGKIKVSVRLLHADKETAKVAFEVSDTGIGIAENKILSIFENFQQASSSTSRLYGGTGLGLAIVKQLVEQQGGTISVKSQPDLGTSFTFELSFGQTQLVADAILEVTEVNAEYRNIKVLVVEDIPLNQLLMKTLLDDFGFEREIAANGRIAIEKLQAQSYDIVLMDLQMPEMNGFEATEYIRKVMKSKIPIIALTADVTTVDVAKCREVGMNDYIAKPVDERVLYTKIVGLVRKPPGIKAGMAFGKEHPTNPIRCIDMAYLNHRTKSNPSLMMEMIGLYLQQTPPLISAMKQGFQEKDWETLHSAVHKIIPSFSIMGIGSDFEN
ncbi:MAG TPA: ATP-binding protein, partial [Bacteroidia bacterium]|nr:ATP-binding protein [Bacteroidia bacterium]